MNPGPDERAAATLEYAKPAARARATTWSGVGLGLALAGAAHVGWIAFQVWRAVSRSIPVLVTPDAAWFLFPVLGTGVSAVGLWRGGRWLGGSGILLGAASVATLLLLKGRW